MCVLHRVFVLLSALSMIVALPTPYQRHAASLARQFYMYNRLMRFVVAWPDNQLELIAATRQLAIDGLRAGTADQAAPWYFRHRSSSAEVGASEWI